jgi:hypothetical protein
MKNHYGMALKIKGGIFIKLNSKQFIYQNNNKIQ